jgi:hypothetical protein
VRPLLLLIAGAAIGLVAWLIVDRPLSNGPVTKTEIEHTVAQRPRGHVASVFCNEEVLPSQKPPPKGTHTWTCDTYLGRSVADQQTGPSYRVIVSEDHIESIRRVPTH